MNLVNKSDSRQMYDIKFTATSKTYNATVEAGSPHLAIGLATKQLASLHNKEPMDFLVLPTLVHRTSSFTPESLPSISLKDIRRYGIENSRNIVDSCTKESYPLHYPPKVPMFRNYSEKGEEHATMRSVDAMNVASFVTQGYVVAGTIKNACTPVLRNTNG